MPALMQPRLLKQPDSSAAVRGAFDALSRASKSLTHHICCCRAAKPNLWKQSGAQWKGPSKAPRCGAAASWRSKPTGGSKPLNSLRLGRCHLPLRQLSNTVSRTAAHHSGYASGGGGAIRSAASRADSSPSADALLNDLREEVDARDTVPLHEVAGKRTPAMGGWWHHHQGLADLNAISCLSTNMVCQG